MMSWMRNHQLLTGRRLGRGAFYALILICVLGPLAITISRLRLIGNAITVLDDSGPALSETAIERMAEVQLPSSTTNLQSHWPRISDSVLRVRFEIASDDLPRLLASSRLPQTLSDREIPPLLKDPFDRDWWQPLQARRFQAARTSFTRSDGGRAYQALLVDTTDERRFVVYLAVLNS